MCPEPHNLEQSPRLQVLSWYQGLFFFYPGAYFLNVKLAELKLKIESAQQTKTEMDITRCLMSEICFFKVLETGGQVGDGVNKVGYTWLIIKAE